MMRTLILACALGMCPAAAMSQPMDPPAPPVDYPPVPASPGSPMPGGNAEPAMPPAPAPHVVTVISNELPPPPPPQAVYPPCSATLHDQCTQTNDPGNRPMRGRR